MTSDPIQHLLDEHVRLLARFAELETAVAHLETEGEAALPRALPIFTRVGRMMATQLDRHRRKEDDVLFPAVEAMIGQEGPTAVMRAEHQDIHAYSRTFRRTLQELNEVEHPQLEAGGERLRQLAAQGANAAALCATGREILALVRPHFEKEEQILFPMAGELLPDEALVAVYNGMMAIEAEGERS